MALGNSIVGGISKAASYLGKNPMLAGGIIGGTAGFIGSGGDWIATAAGAGIGALSGRGVKGTSSEEYRAAVLGRLGKRQRSLAEAANVAGKTLSERSRVISRNNRPLIKSLGTLKAAGNDLSKELGLGGTWKDNFVQGSRFTDKGLSREFGGLRKDIVKTQRSILGGVKEMKTLRSNQIAAQNKLKRVSDRVQKWSARTAEKGWSGGPKRSNFNKRMLVAGGAGLGIGIAGNFLSGRFSHHPGSSYGSQSSAPYSQTFSGAGY